MSEFEFTLVIDGDLEDEAVLDKLFEAGCDDATFGVIDGIGYGDFHREARSFIKALVSAIKAVEGPGGLKVLHVEPDDVVTMADIAHRLDKSREYVRLLVAGRKGRGGFPPPISHLRGRSRLWRWSDVATWAGMLDEEAQEQAQFIAAVNALLELRRSRLGKQERERLLKVVAV
jgi:hypothetical protein